MLPHEIANLDHLLNLSLGVFLGEFATLNFVDEDESDSGCGGEQQQIVDSALQ